MSIKRVVIVDDEPAARQALREVINAFPQLDIVGEFSDGRSAIDGITALTPDILFLDIEMPEVNGFVVAKATQDYYGQLVFVTAYERYALDAFDTRAIDYLLKPVRPTLIERCIHKILNQEDRILDSARKDTLPNKTLTLTDNDLRVLDWDHINLIEGMGRYRRIHLTLTGQSTHQVDTILSDMTLHDFERQLPEPNFMRLHRSYIINTQQVTRLYTRLRRHFVTIKGSELSIPVSRNQVVSLRGLLESERI